MIEVAIRFLAVIGLFTCALGGMTILAVGIYWYQRHLRDRFYAACCMSRAIREYERKRAA